MGGEGTGALRSASFPGGWGVGGGGNILAFVFERYPGLLTVLLEVDGGQGHFEVFFFEIYRVPFAVVSVVSSIKPTEKKARNVN